MKKYTVGFGFDVHKFSRKAKPLILGGVKIPSSLSLEAVSDGDLVLHAISDAICGACGLGDIGDYFPPRAKKSKNVDSREIVTFLLKKIKPRYQIINIDVVIVCDRPPLVKHKPKITKSLRKIFLTSKVNLKVKSKEGLDILGTKKGISCLATALLVKK